MKPKWVLFLATLGTASLIMGFAVVLVVFGLRDQVLTSVLALVSVLFGEYSIYRLVASFPDKHKAHADKIAAAVREYTQSVELLPVGHPQGIEVQAMLMRDDEDSHVFRVPDDRDAVEYWREARVHIRSGSIYGNADKAIRKMEAVVRKHSALGNALFNRIREKAEKELAETFPNLTPITKPNQPGVHPKNMEEHVWSGLFNLPRSSVEPIGRITLEKLTSESSATPLYHVCLVDDNHHRVAIVVTDGAIATIATDRLRELLLRLVRDKELLKGANALAAEETRAREALLSMREHLQEVAMRVESEQELDGTCEFCPTLFWR